MKIPVLVSISLSKTIIINVSEKDIDDEVVIEDTVKQHLKNQLSGLLSDGWNVDEFVTMKDTL